MSNIAHATDADRPDVEALVARLALPIAGLADQFPNAYVLVRRGPDLVGVAGVEIHGRDGLLRSVAVAPEARNTGLARLLVEDRLASARARGLDAVYLLTTTAATYFPRLGFVPTERSRAPEALAASAEFASVCPASAHCLVIRF